MLTQTYDIYFSGKIIDGNDPTETRVQVGKLFKANHNQLEKLFSGNPVKIRSDVDEETATKYRITLQKVGALVEIKPSSTTTTNSIETRDNNNDSRHDATDNLTLMPAGTGSLIDYAPIVTPQPLPETDHLSLAPTGTIIDESPDPKPVEINTDGLSVNPANSGTLEDCKKEVEPYPIPDITHLELDKH